MDSSKGISWKPYEWNFSEISRWILQRIQKKIVLDFARDNSRGSCRDAPRGFWRNQQFSQIVPEIHSVIYPLIPSVIFLGNRSEIPTIFFAETPPGINPGKSLHGFLQRFLHRSGISARITPEKSLHGFQISSVSLQILFHEFFFEGFLAG